jgi:hypothetical protein
MKREIGQVLLNHSLSGCAVVGGGLLALSIYCDKANFDRATSSSE